jgi:GTP-binding protein HflX
MSLIERSFREKIVLVGVITPDTHPETVEQSLDELALLVDTAGADVVARVVQRRDTPDPATFVGRGKAEEIRDLSYEVDSDTVVFDEELSPAQQRNLEKIFGRTAIDRTAVILDIFAQNARTLEGKAQVELALLRYRLPRLRGRGVSLSRQGGGIGSRMGGGETKLELDRRRILRRISHLEHELKEATKTRVIQRKARQRARNHSVSLVGYTNAGKSTLLNAITDAGTATENRLFSTLDPVVRRGQLSGGETVLFSDTVGFVRKLPHQLVEAFRSTLDEVNDADLLVHVVDGSAANPEEQLRAVHHVLSEIEREEIPELLVFNKTDRLNGDGERSLQILMDRYPGSVRASALNGDGVENVIEAIAARLRALQTTIDVILPFDRGDLLAQLHREGEVLTEEALEGGMAVRARVDDATLAAVAEFVQPPSGGE